MHAGFEPGTWLCLRRSHVHDDVANNADAATDTERDAHANYRRDFSYLLSGGRPVPRSTAVSSPVFVSRIRRAEILISVHVQPRVGEMRAHGRGGPHANAHALRNRLTAWLCARIIRALSRSRQPVRARLRVRDSRAD